MDNKLRNDLMDIAAELVVAPLTAYVKGREIYTNFKESDASTKLYNYADQKGQEISQTAKRISVSFNDKASKFAEDISGKAMDFSKKASEFSKKAEETIDNLSERTDSAIYEFTGKADDALKEFSDNVKGAAKDFGGVVQQKFNERQEQLNKEDEEPIAPQANTIFAQETEPEVKPETEEKVETEN